MNRRIDICRLCGEPRKRHTDRLTYCATVGCYERDRVFVLPPRPAASPTSWAPSPAARAKDALVVLALVVLAIAAFGFVVWGQP